MRTTRLRPVTVYAVSKAACEMHCLALNRWWGHPVVVIRNFNTFGPHQNIVGYPAVTVAFARRALRGEPLPLENGGRQTRDFMYIDDAVDAYTRVIDQDATLAGSVFNIGTGRETDHPRRGPDGAGGHRIRQRDRGNARAGAPILPALRADATRIRQATGWQPVTPFEEGMRRTVDWLRAVDA